MTPYYEQDGIVIYHGDCREVLPLVNADVLVTDPPYGVNLGDAGVGQNGNGPRHGLLKGRYDTYSDTYENFLLVVVPSVEQALASVRRGAVFTGPHLWDMPRADAIGGVFCPSAAGRHRWGFKTLLPVLLYGTAPDLQNGAGSRPNVITSTVRAEVNGHPCPKPVEWMRWLVQLASFGDEVILDPFMGSGTTLRAAKDLGRRAIGIEIEERYCEIAAKAAQPVSHVRSRGRMRTPAVATSQIGRGVSQTLVIKDWLPAQMANGSVGHWSQRQKKLKAAQIMVWAAAKQDGLQPVVGRAKVTINLVFPVNRRRDADGLHSRIKGVLDGLVRGGWLDDDSTDHIELLVTAEVRPGQKATEITLESADVDRPG